MLGIYNPELMNIANNSLNNFKLNVQQQSSKYNASQTPAQPIVNNNLLSSAGDFFNQNKGKALTSPEGGYSNECVSTLRQYWSNIGIKTAPAGNAWDMFKNFGSNGLTDKQFTKIDSPQKNGVQAGDAFFLAPNQNGAGGVGHTGYIKTAPDKNGNVTVVDSNWNGGKIQERSINIKNINGILRPKI